MIHLDIISPLPEVNLARLPAYMIVMHRLARLGKGDVYAPGSKRFVRFLMSQHQATMNKWADLKDVDQLTIIYRSEGHR